MGVRKTYIPIFLHQESVWRGIRGDCVLLLPTLLLFPQRKMPAKPAKSQSFMVSKQHRPEDNMSNVTETWGLTNAPCATVYHAQAQVLTCSWLNMDPQHASQQPSSSTSSDGYCLPLTNCQETIPLLQMPIDQSAGKSVGKELPMLLSHCRLSCARIFQIKDNSIKLNPYQ